MVDSNFARSFVKKNASRIRCEPSGLSYKELTREWSLMRELLKSR